MEGPREVHMRSKPSIEAGFSLIELAIVLGDPIVVPDGAGADELEEIRLAVEHGLNSVTRRAYRLAGGKDPLARVPGSAT